MSARSHCTQWLITADQCRALADKAHQAGDARMERIARIAARALDLYKANGRNKAAVLECLEAIRNAEAKADEVALGSDYTHPDYEYMTLTVPFDARVLSSEFDREINQTMGYSRVWADITNGGAYIVYRRPRRHT